MDLTYKKDEIKNIVEEIVLPNKQKLVYEAILNNPNSNKPRIRELSGLSDNSVKNAIQALSKKGLIYFDGKSAKTGGYFIKTMQ